MNSEVYEKYIQAGKIASEAREYGASLIKPGVRLLEVANKVESKITDKGAGIAFPVNISINEIAAHYTSNVNDDKTFQKGDVVKIDVGAHVDGYIADTAKTVEVQTKDHSDMIEAVEEGLNIAIDMIRPDIDLSKLGKKVQDKIHSYGFKPVDNLTGHSLEQYVLHAGTSIPSVADALNISKIKKDDVVAIEPFATNGAGHVIQGNGSNIYLCDPSLRAKFVRDNKIKTMYNKLYKEFKSLPFAQRWADKIIPKSEINLRKISFHGFLKHYPQLIDAKKGIVTQREHTVIITDDGCEVTTC